MKKVRKRFIIVILLFFVLSYNLTTYFYTFSEFVSEVDDISSGVYDNFVIINDLEKDYDYYMGLNYVSSDGTLPTLVDKNLYNSENMVYTKIVYFGNDISGLNKGYVSLDERQDTYVYYKYYIINDNGTSVKTDDYIEIELIDNPFSDRPTDMGFNGWSSDYSNIDIYFDSEYYVRYAKVPVTYVDNIPNSIDISFYANWKDAKVGFINSNNSWGGAFGILDDAGMQPVGGQIPIYESIEGLYLRYSISFGNNYPTGAVNSNGNSVSGWCSTFFGSCTYYLPVDENSQYDASQTYYELAKNGNNSTMREHEIGIIGYDNLPNLPEGTVLSGYFRRVDLTGLNIDGYYSEIGLLQSSSICRSNCIYYELIDYYDLNGNVNYADGQTIYYYLATRDTNIVVMNGDVNSKWTDTSNIPFTLTSVHNGIDYTDDVTWNVSNQYITCYSDVRIENIRINSNSNNSSGDPVSNATSTRHIYANYYNLKIGRGIKQSGSYKTFNGIFGGNNNTSAIGSANDVIKYKLVVESGWYNTITLTNGPSNTNRTKYIEALGVYGNDYDRVSGDTNLDVYFETAGSWGAGNYYASTNTGITFDTVIKSGNFGTGKSDHTTGVYVGGRAYGTHYTSRRIKVEGGWIYNLIGGPLTASNRANINDTYIYMTGGSVDMITGGAGTSTTYGNRIIAVTGGTVNYSVFGGSNSYSGNTSDGKLTGSSYVYIGGNAIIGDERYVTNNSTLWGAEAGSVFGIGNGNNSSSTIGSNENSNIVINGGRILRNVYGGGNYSATGIESTSSKTVTNIKMINGVIDGSLYGGGNNNGSGSNSIPSNLIIDIYNGTINGSIYGGSKTQGTIYGDVNLNIKGGLFNDSIYGGGQGNDTYIAKNVNIIFGDNSLITSPVIVNNLYGGSEFGSTNGNGFITSYKTNITINKGNIFGSVFGGAKGDNSFSPNVYGNVKLVVNNGNVNNIFGANDHSGKIFGITEIYLNGGEVTSVYGGGNKTSQDVTNIYLQGSVINSIFGGSNESGDVETSNITVTSGSSNRIFGGNNIGGVTDISKINLNGGEVTSVYGGGNKTSLNESFISLNGSKVTDIFGGSNESGDVETSNITVTSGSLNRIFGGNNIGGVTNISKINLNGGEVTSVYGGGNKTSLNESFISLNGSKVTDIFGGSNESGDVRKTNVTITRGNVSNVFGGNNIGGVTTDSSVIVDGGISTTIYGGGKLATTNTSNVVVNSSNIGSLYGGGENASVSSTNITVNNGTIESVFGGSNNSGDVINSTIKVYDGNITNLYGGNNTGGTTDKTSLVIEGSSITNLYGGGNNAKTNITNVLFNNGIIDNMFGGGNDENGITSTTEIYLNGGNISNLYGGGNKASTTTSNVNLNGTKVTNLYGGGNESGINYSNINLNNGNVSNVFGGSNISGNVNNVNISTGTNVSGLDIDVDYSIVEVDPYWQDTNYNTVVTLDVTLTNNTDEPINDYTGYIKLINSKLYSNYSSTAISENNGIYTFTDNNNYNSSSNVINSFESFTFQFSVYSKSQINDFKIDDYGINIGNSVNSGDLKIVNLYGGNNKGGLADNIRLTLNSGEYDNIYGGGNQAVSNSPVLKLNNVIVNNRVYGGANQASVTNNTDLEIINCIINGSIFGGGNAGLVGKDSNLYISKSNIKESVYAGGNGNTAIVVGNTNLSIDGGTVVGKHVFGGGNAANTGNELSNVITTLNIAGATIGGNVYGAGNTSVVYGTTNVNIGHDTLTKNDLIKDDIVITGTVFGGGEANEQGSENYDYSFISVTNGTNININGNHHNQLTIKGSIFGSGNASSTEGYSYINISNYGNVEEYKNNISIQRANLVIIDNSVIELEGTTDRTNEYSSVLFSLSRIKHLKLKNGSILYLNNGANLLEEYTSAVDINGEEKLQIVSFTDNKIVRNNDNRIYIQGGKNLNIATNENSTAYGRINGMTFFGLYTKDRNNNILTGIYDNYNFGDIPLNNDIYLFDAGSYVLGRHKANHNIKTDGFYSNYVNEGVIYVDYIKPTPDDSTYYMWSIGEQVVTIELYLSASKYLTLGTEELGMLNYSAPNTTFSIVGFNYNDLDSKVNLLEESEVPRIAATSEQADNNMSLVMKATNSGWITKGETTFLTTDDSIVGKTSYKSENTTEVPTFQFYIYHSKNLGSSGDMGSVTISFIVSTPVDDLTNDVQRVNLVVNLDRKLYNTNDYEASMTIGKEYDLFGSTGVNLTADGSFSAYYSLFVENTDTIYKNGYHRSLVSTYVFPVNTKLTLLNLNEESVNEYYYYVITEDDYIRSLKEYEKNNEVSYDFSKFIRMGSTSTNNNYDDKLNNTKYYNSSTRILLEEFIVIVDFVDSNITEDVLDKSLLIELRDASDNTVVSVLGIEQERMVYSLYTNSNAVVDVEGVLSSDKVYPGNEVELLITTDFNRKIVDSETIFDTNYFEQQLGVKITYLDSNGNQVTGASLLGVTYECDGSIYYPRMDGSVRIKLAEKMANVATKIKINTTDSVAAGNYTMVIESFGSPDGIYYGGVSSDMDTIPISILNTVYGLSLNMGDYLLIRDSGTGNNLNDNNDLKFNIKYSSALSNPNLRMSLYRRNYDSIYSTDYEMVDLQEFVIQELNTTNNVYEYLLTDEPLGDITYTYQLNENLKTGTYKFVISLYDNDIYIGNVYKYIIIKERYHE